MSSSTTNGATTDQDQKKGQSRTERRKEWYWKNKREFSKKLRDRTTLSKKENEQQKQTDAVSESSRGFRTTVATKLAATASKHKKSGASDRRLSSPQSQKQKPKTTAKFSSKVPTKSEKVAKKKPKVVGKTPKPKQKVEKVEEIVKPEMVSEISMNARGVELLNASSHIPQKYILFIGNLPYTIDKGQLMSHFRITGGVKSVRIPKDKSGTPKGFAYLEFKDRISHGIALRLHHTTLGGRKINVEFSTSENKKKGQDKESSQES